jgi:AcrR family transcriptional regulator
MKKNAIPASPRRSYLISLDHRKPRGAGCERPGEILKAARELFLTQGVENVTTRQIAARVGISQTALYVYFSCKEEMLDSLAEDAWRALADVLAAADVADADPFARLRAILAAYMRFWLRRPDDFRVIFMRRSLRNWHPDDKDRTVAHDCFLERLAERFREAAQAGLTRDAWDAESVALGIWAAVSGPVMLRVGFPDLRWPPEDDHIKETVDMIIRACENRGGKSAAKAFEPGAEDAALAK